MRLFINQAKCWSAEFYTLMIFYCIQLHKVGAFPLPSSSSWSATRTQDSFTKTWWKCILVLASDTKTCHMSITSIKNCTLLFKLISKQQPKVGRRRYDCNSPRTMHKNTGRFLGHTGNLLKYSTVKENVLDQILVKFEDFVHIPDLIF